LNGGFGDEEAAVGLRAEFGMPLHKHADRSADDIAPTLTKVAEIFT
jgi:hypothetical protein